MKISSSSGAFSKSESYGWVFKQGSKLMSDSNSQPPSLSKTLSGDCVFVENKRLANSSLTSEKPLKIWAQKRRKILQEISLNRRSLLSDNDLPFPEFNYCSYMTSMLPRIKHTSLTRTHSATNSLDHSKYEKSTSISTNKFSHEMCTKNAFPTKIRRASINRSHKIITKIDTNYLCNYIDDSTKISLSNSNRQDSPNTDQFVSHDGKDHKIFKISSRNEISSKHNIPENETIQVLHGSSEIHCHKEYCNDSKNSLRNQGTHFEEVFDYPNDTKDSNGTKTKFDFSSVSSGFESEIFTNDPETSSTINPSEFSSVSQIKNILMKSFKTVGEKEYNSVHNSESTIPRRSYLSEEVFTPSEHRPTIVQEAMAGEIIPISVRNILSSRNSSIPISANELGTFKNEEIYELQGENSVSYSKISLTDVQLRAKVGKFTNKREETLNQELKYAELQQMTQIEGKLKRLRNNFSATESTPVENSYSVGENCSNHFQDFINDLPNDKKSNAQDTIVENASAETFAETECKEGIKSRGKRKSAIRYPSIFTGSIGSDGKTDISNLIMDADSLVGLSDEELLDRTRRIRQLRKSVEVRSKQRKSMTAF